MHAVIKTQEDFFIKNIYFSLYCKGSKRFTQSLRVRGSWRPNITEIFWPQSYGRQCCVFLVLHGCSTGDLAFLTTSRLISVSSFLASTQLSVYCLVELNCLCSIRRPYITFKLPRGDMDTPLQFLPISGDWDVSLSSDASVYESIMGFFFIPRPISSANFRPRDFLS